MKPAGGVRRECPGELPHNILLYVRAEPPATTRVADLRDGPLRYSLNARLGRNT